jgi:hypothetical protein
LPSRVAPQIDDVGSLGPEVLGLTNQFIGRKLRCVIDLGEDLDPVVAISSQRVDTLSKVATQVAEIFGPRFDGNTGTSLGDRGEISPAEAWENDARDSARRIQVAGNPAGSQKRGD